MKNILDKLLTVLFMAVMILAGAAAGLAIFFIINGDMPWQKEDSVQAVSDVADRADGADKADAPEDAGESESVSRQAGDLGSYYVEITGASSAEDLEGKPAIVVTCTWTNNSASAISSFDAIRVKAFQNDVQLESAVVINKEKFDSSNYMQDVQPGATIRVQHAFRLVSKTADVEIEASALDGSSEGKVVMDYALAKLG